MLTLIFEKNTIAGNVVDKRIDVVKIGGYFEGEYQYFYMKMEKSGINAPYKLHLRTDSRGGYSC